MKKKTVLIIARGVMTFALLGVIVFQIDWLLFWKTLAGIKLIWISVPCFLYFHALYLSGWRWKLVLNSLGESVPLRSLLGSLWIGMFFVNFMPSTIGSDLYRVYDQGKTAANFSLSGISVLIDRLIGLTGLFVLGSIASVLFYPLFDAIGLLWISCLLIPVSLTLIIANFYPLILCRFVPNFIQHAKLFQQFLLWANHQGENRLGIIKALILSIVLHFQSAVAGFCILYALRLDISFQHTIPLLLVINILSVVPVSINSWGVREGAFVYLLGFLGVSNTDALAAALLGRVLMLFFSMGGALLYLRQSANRVQSENVTGNFSA